MRPVESDSRQASCAVTTTNLGMRVLLRSRNATVIAGVESALSHDPATSVEIVAPDRPGIAGPVPPDVIIQHGLRAFLAQPAAPPAPVLVVDDSPDGADIPRALRRGVGAVICLAHDLEMVPLGCRVAIHGSRYLSPSIIAILVDHLSGGLDRQARARFALTPRESETLRLLATGMGQPDIAKTMAVRPRTIRYHLGNIYRKLQVSDQAAAVALAYREGLVG